MTAPAGWAQLVRVGAAFLLLASPTILAFRTGGFPAEVTLWAGIAAFTVLAVVMLSPLPLPRTRLARVSIAALGGLTLWITASIAWSPLKDQALRDAERSALYLALLVVGIVVLRDRALLRRVEPLLALGVVIVGAYALATRLLPGALDASRSVAAGARLEQPLTYWNALGLLMAFGVLLVIRVAGDDVRRRATRVAACAAGPPLVLALYLTLSRGAIAAGAVGGVVLLAAARRRPVLDAAVVVVAAGGALAAAASRFDAVDSLAGGAADLRRQGLAVLVLTLAAATVAGLAAVGLGRLERIGVTWTHWLGRRRVRWLAATAVLAAAAALIAFAPRPALEEPSVQPGGPTAADGGPGGQPARDPSRLRTLESDRYEYWRVAAGELTAQPLHGLGSGAFAALWLRERDRPARALDAHSLYLETALELGLVGLLLLGALLAAAATLVFRHGAAYPGLAAVMAAWAVHAGWDWDWEMPAVTAPFLVAVAALAAAHEERRTRGS